MEDSDDLNSSAAEGDQSGNPRNDETESEFQMLERQFIEQKAKIEYLSQENAKMSAEIGGHAEQVMSLETTISRKEEENLKMSELCVELSKKAQNDADISSLKELCKDLEVKVCTLTAEKLESDKAKMAAESRAAELESEKHHLSAQKDEDISNLKGMCEDLEVKVNMLEAEKLEIDKAKMAAETRSAELESEKHQQSEQKDADISSLKEMCEDLEVKVSTLEAEKHHQSAQKDADISSLKKMCEDLEVKVSTLKAENLEMDKSKIAAESRAAELESERHHQSAQKDADISSLKKMCEDLEVKVSTLEAEKHHQSAQKDADISSLKKMCEDLEVKVSTLEAEKHHQSAQKDADISSLKKMCEDLEVKVSTLEAKNLEMDKSKMAADSRAAELESERHHQSAQKDADISSLKEMCKDLEVKISTLEAEKLEVDKSKMAAESRAAELESEKHQQSAQKDADISSLKEMCKDLDVKISTLEAEKLEIDKAKMAAEMRSAELESEKHQQSAQKDADISSLKEMCKDLEVKISTLEAEKLEVDKAKMAAESRAAELESEKNHLSAQKDADISSLKEMCKDLEVKISTLEAEKVEVDKAKMAAESRAAELESKKHHLSAQKDEDISNLKGMCKDLEVKISTLEAEKLEIDKSKIAAEIRSAELESEKHHLSAQKDEDISNLKRMCEDLEIKISTLEVEKLEIEKASEIKFAKLESEKHQMSSQKDVEISSLQAMCKDLELKISTLEAEKLEDVQVKDEMEKKILELDAQKEEEKAQLRVEFEVVKIKMEEEYKEAQERFLKESTEAKQRANDLLDKITSLENEKQSLEKLKESQKSKMHMLLLTLKRKEADLTALAGDKQRLTEQNDDLLKDVSEKNTLMADAQKLHSRIEQLEETEKRFAELVNDDATLPWETNEDLGKLTPLEILDQIGDTLNLRVKVKLYELCVSELKQRLRTKNEDLGKMVSAYRSVLKSETTEIDTTSSDHFVRMTRSVSQTSTSSSAPGPLSVAIENEGVPSRKRLGSTDKSDAEKRARALSPPRGLSVFNRTDAKVTLLSDAPENPFARRTRSALVQSENPVLPKDKSREETRVCSSSPKKSLR